MPGEGAYEHPHLGIPQPAGLIPTPTCDFVSIGTKCHAIDIIRMPGESMYEHPHLGIPQPEGIIITITCDFVSIGTKCHALDTTRMPVEGMYEMPRVGIPQPDGPTPPFPLPVAILFPSGLNVTLLTPPVCPGEGADEGPGVGIPQLDGLISTSTCDFVSIGD